MDKYPHDRSPNPETEWNLELMSVSPQRKGYGTILLDFVKDYMSEPFSVCPIDEGSYTFFVKNGMSPDYVVKN